MAVVAAIGMLALVAGKSAYTSGAATEVSPTYRMLHPGRDVTPKMGVAAPVVRDHPRPAPSMQDKTIASH